MSRYFINEGAFELPLVGITDATVNVLALSGGARLFVERGPAREGETARVRAVARSKHEAGELAKFTVLGEREGEVGGVTAFEVAARYREGMGLCYQRRAHLVHGGMSYVLTLRGVMGAREELDAHMDHVLSTLRFRAG